MIIDEVRLRTAIENQKKMLLKKWGSKCNPNIMLLIMMEELGEVSKEVLGEKSRCRLRDELIDLLVPTVILLEYVNSLIKEVEKDFKPKNRTKIGN